MQGQITSYIALQKEAKAKPGYRTVQGERL